MNVDVSPRNTHKIWLWVIPALLIAAWLGVRGLNADMIWYDEYWSIWSAGGAHFGPLPVDEVLDRAINEPSQPPTYYLMLSAWGTFTGWTPLAARYLSFVMGVLALAWTYRLGADTVNPRVGALATLLLGSAAIYVTYLHELRLYAMMALFATMTLSLYWRVLNAEKPHPATQALLAFSVVMAFYSHYFTLLAVSAVGLYHLLFVPKNGRWWRLTLLMAVGGVAFLPWVGYTLGAVDQFVGTGGRTDTASPTGEVLTLFTYALSNGTFILAVIVLLAFGGWRRLRREHPAASTHGIEMIATVALLILAQGLVLNLLTRVLTHTRYILAIWPPLMILAALGLLWLAGQGRGWRWLTVGIVAVWMGAGAYNSLTPEFNDRLFRDVHTEFFRPNLPLNEVGEIIHAESAPGDAVALHSPYSAWAIGGGFDLALHGVPARYTIIDQVPEGIEPLDYMQNFVGDAGRVWLAVEHNPLADASATTEARAEAASRLAQFEGLIGDYVYCDQHLDRETLQLDLYARHPLFCAAGDGGTVAAFGGGVALNGVDLAVNGEGTLQVRTTWHTDGDVPPSTYSVGMYVFDAVGEFVAQGSDYELPTGDFRYHTAAFPLDLPPGDYTLTLAVYNWQTGERLPVAGGTDALIGEFKIPDQM